MNRRQYSIRNVCVSITVRQLEKLTLIYWHIHICLIHFLFMPNNNKPFFYILDYDDYKWLLFFSLENGICIGIIQNFYRRFCSNKEKKCNNFIKFIHAGIRRLIILDYFTNKRWFEIVSSLSFFCFMPVWQDDLTYSNCTERKKRKGERERMRERLI
jgi:hypothetical protein